jgi:hypothetical protein
MRYTLLFAGGMVAAALVGAAPAYAGPPNVECEDFSSSPGNAATSPGSVFNEPGVDSASGGKGNQAYNNAEAPSQYDVGCAKVSAADAGTPIQVIAPIDPKTGESTAVITNNSRATREALGVTHMGKGANK